MAYFERIRDMVSGPFSSDIMQQRMTAGWQLVSMEWRRELPDDQSPSEGAFNEDIPYGLRISDDCKRLEVDATENLVLTQMMDLVVEDFSFSSIASALNEKGFRTRDGKLWSQISVFNMLPRLIEVGSRLFSTEDWKTRRERLSKKA
jgi:Recombinase